MSTPVTECCYASGGRASVSINGILVGVRSVTITPIPYERSVASNQDGSIYTTFKPMPAEADIVLSDACGMTLEDLMGCPINATIVLIDVKRTYLFTNGVMVGRPTINTETGEIRGLKITANNPTYTNN
jgi:hypothetical protein